MFGSVCPSHYLTRYFYFCFYQIHRINALTEIKRNVGCSLSRVLRISPKSVLWHDEKIHLHVLCCYSVCLTTRNTFVYVLCFNTHWIVLCVFCVWGGGGMCCFECLSDNIASLPWGHASLTWPCGLTGWGIFFRTSLNVLIYLLLAQFLCLSLFLTFTDAE